MSEPDASSKRSSLRSQPGAAGALGALEEERGDSAPAPHQVGHDLGDDDHDVDHDLDDNDDPQVQGGDNEDLGMVNYHPFYITSSRDGGYGMGLLSSS